MHPRPFREPSEQTDAPMLRTQWTETIMKVTGATGEVAWILEGIARDEIFDGTLDAASKSEIENAFKEAMRIFRSDEATYREMYGIEG